MIRENSNKIWDKMDVESLCDNGMPGRWLAEFETNTLRYLARPDTIQYTEIIKFRCDMVVTDHDTIAIQYSY